MKNLFLWLDIILLLLPFLLLLDKKYFSLSNILKSLLPALVATIIYSEMGVFFGAMKIWEFNSEYLTGITYRFLPLEQYLFYYGFNFFSLTVYQYWNARSPKPELEYSLIISNLFLGLCIALLFAAYSKWYNVLNVFSFMLILVLVEYRGTLRYMPKYYRAALAILPVFACIQILLCQLDVYKFTWIDTLNSSLFKMPFEQIFMCLGMFLLAVGSFEWISSRRFKYA